MVSSIPLNAYRRIAHKKARMQRKLAGMVKYSQNWKKQQRRIAQLDIRIANCRHDFLHQLRTETSGAFASTIVALVLDCLRQLPVLDAMRLGRFLAETRLLVGFANRGIGGFARAHKTVAGAFVDDRLIRFPGGFH